MALTKHDVSMTAVLMFVVGLVGFIAGITCVIVFSTQKKGTEFVRVSSSVDLRSFQFTVTDLTWTDEFNDPTSAAFQQHVQQIQKDIASKLEAPEPQTPALLYGMDDYVEEGEDVTRIDVDYEIGKVSVTSLRQSQTEPGMVLAFVTVLYTAQNDSYIPTAAEEVKKIENDSLYAHVEGHNDPINFCSVAQNQAPNATTLAPTTPALSTSPTIVTVPTTTTTTKATVPTIPTMPTIATVPPVTTTTTPPPSPSPSITPPTPSTVSVTSPTSASPTTPASPTPSPSPSSSPTSASSSTSPSPMTSSPTVPNTPTSTSAALSSSSTSPGTSPTTMSPTSTSTTVPSTTTTPASTSPSTAPSTSSASSSSTTSSTSTSTSSSSSTSPTTVATSTESSTSLSSSTSSPMATTTSPSTSTTASSTSTPTSTNTPTTSTTMTSTSQTPSTSASPSTFSPASSTTSPTSASSTGSTMSSSATQTSVSTTISSSSTSESTSSPTSTTPSTTSTTMPTTTTPPLLCVPNGTYAYADVVVLYDLSVDVVPNTPNLGQTEVLMENYMFADAAFQWGLLMAAPIPFPLTANYVQYDALIPLTDERAQFQGAVTGQAVYSTIVGGTQSNINDGLNYLLNTSIGHRSSAPLVVVIIARQGNLAANAAANVNRLKGQDASILTVSLGDADFTDFNGLATNASYNFNLKTFDNATFSTFSSQIGTLLKSICARDSAPPPTTPSTATTPTVTTPITSTTSVASTTAPATSTTATQTTGSTSSGFTSTTMTTSSSSPSTSSISSSTTSGTSTSSTSSVSSTSGTSPTTSESTASTSSMSSTTSPTTSVSSSTTTGPTSSTTVTSTTPSTSSSTTQTTPQSSTSSTPSSTSPSTSLTPPSSSQTSTSTMETSTSSSSSTSESTSSPTSTTPSTTSTTTTMPTTTTPPLLCVPNGTYAYADVVVLYDLSVDVVPNTPSAGQTNTLVGSYLFSDAAIHWGTLMATAIPFPLTAEYSTAGATLPLTARSGQYTSLVSAQIVYAPIFNGTQSDINDGLNYLLNISIGHRSSAPLVVVIIARQGNLAADAAANVNRLKGQDASILTVSLGDADFTDFNGLATNASYNFNLKTFDNATFSTFSSQIGTLLKSICARNSVPTTTAPTTTTKSTTTAPTTTTVPTTTAFACPSNQVYIYQDIAVLFNVADPSKYTQFVGSQLFADDSYHLDQVGNKTRIIIKPYPDDNDVFSTDADATYDAVNTKAALVTAANLAAALHPTPPVQTDADLKNALTYLINVNNGPSRRAGIAGTLILITQDCKGAADASVALPDWKLTNDVLLITVGTADFSCYQGFPSKPSYLYSIPDFGNSTTVNAVISEVQQSLILASPVC